MGAGVALKGCPIASFVLPRTYFLFEFGSRDPLLRAINQHLGFEPSNGHSATTASEAHGGCPAIRLADLITTCSAEIKLVYLGVLIPKVVREKDLWVPRPDQDSSVD